MSRHCDPWWLNGTITGPGLFAVSRSGSAKRPGETDAGNRWSRGSAGQTYPDEEPKRGQAGKRPGFPNNSGHLRWSAFSRSHRDTSRSRGILHVGDGFRTNCGELRIDDFARAEVERRIRNLENELRRRRLLPFGQANAAGRGVEWVHEGKAVRIESRAGNESVS